MEGVRSFDEIYAFYRDDEVTDFCRATMIPFLDLVADVLRSKPLFYGTSRAQLSLSRYGTWTESSRNPSILIFADHPYVMFSYHEMWEEGGEYFRWRNEGIKCRVQDAPKALLEMLARLKV